LCPPEVKGLAPLAAGSFTQSKKHWFLIWILGDPGKIRKLFMVMQDAVTVSEFEILSKAFPAPGILKIKNANTPLTFSN